MALNMAGCAAWLRQRSLRWAPNRRCSDPEELQATVGGVAWAQTPETSTADVWIYVCIYIYMYVLYTYINSITVNIYKYIISIYFFLWVVPLRCSAWVDIPIIPFAFHGHALIASLAAATWPKHFACKKAAPFASFALDCIPTCHF